MLKESLLSIVGYIILGCSYPVSIILVIVSRIPISRTIVYKFRVKAKAINIAEYIRGFGESIVGNQALFFTTENDTDPKFLYVSNKEILTINEESIKFDFSSNPPGENVKTALITLETKKSIIGGHLPAKLIDIKYIGVRPEWSK